MNRRNTLLRTGRVFALLALATPALAQNDGLTPEGDAFQQPETPAVWTNPDRPQPTRQADPLDGFDFGQVLERMEQSVDPLQQEMSASFEVFVVSMQRAEELLAAGDVRSAVEEAVVAINGVLDARDRVVTPMWEGQQFLTEQTAKVRQRLAMSLTTEDLENLNPQLDERSELMLDRVATQISEETDNFRRRRLIAHYRAIRNLAEVRQMSQQLTPDQQALWMSVLSVLQEAQQTHLELMLGSETMFEQFEVSAQSLEGYLTLMETLDGASEMLGRVRGAGEEGSGLAEFAEAMNSLQSNLAGFNQSVERLISESMTQLETDIDTIRDQQDLNITDGDDGLDDELRARIERIDAE